MKRIYQWFKLLGKRQLLKELEESKRLISSLRRDVAALERKSNMLLRHYLVALNACPNLHELPKFILRGATESTEVPPEDPIFELSDEEFKKQYLNKEI